MYPIEVFLGKCFHDNSFLRNNINWGQELSKMRNATQYPSRGNNYSSTHTIGRQSGREVLDEDFQADGEEYDAAEQVGMDFPGITAALNTK